MELRKGKTKTLLESSIDSALLAVEVYNKPRTSFRTEGFITLMVIAWTRLFHAYFYKTIGDKYYYKEKGRYKTIDSERKAWELATCITKYSPLSEPVKKNIEFFIKLRNKIEHRHIEKREVDVLIFGECQSLLYNYENLLINLFGKQYAINEALVYSLQFSHLRTSQQIAASKSALSKDLSDLVSYIETYRSSLTDQVFDSQEYSIKLIQIPKISNTNRADTAIEFVKLDELSAEDKAAYEQIAVIIKDKKIMVEAANVGRLKPGEVVAKVNENFPAAQLTIPLHSCLFKIFSVRPSQKAEDPFETNPEFCHYDEVHNDYVYQDSWVNFLTNLFQSGRVTSQQIRQSAKSGVLLDVDNYRV